MNFMDRAIGEVEHSVNRVLYDPPTFQGEPVEFTPSDRCEILTGEAFGERDECGARPWAICNHCEMCLCASHAEQCDKCNLYYCEGCLSIHEC